MLLNSRYSFGLVAILIHWVAAALIFGLMVLGFLMTRSSIDPVIQFSFYQFHKSFGLLVLALGVIRILWRATVDQPQPVAALSPVERRTSKLMHHGLAFLGVVLPFTGWALVSTSTLNMPTLLFNRILIPDLPLERATTSESVWTSVHQVLAYTMLGGVALHAGAALYHHSFRHDAVLSRMLPWSGIARKK